MKVKFLSILAAAIFMCLSCGSPQSSDGNNTGEPEINAKKKGNITMATTTSTYDSGLLDYLNPLFTKKTGIDVHVVAMGTGAAFRAGEEGNVDLILVHDTKGEIKFVEEGYGIERRDVMYNDFIILGPSGNPAGLAKDDTAAEAFTKIADAEAEFISRGDDSGTHRREQEIWRTTGLPLEETGQTIVKSGTAIVIISVKPPGEWYLAIGQGMGAALNMANEKQAYVLTDKGTYLAYKVDLDLSILCEGDPVLINQYGIIPVNPERHPAVKKDLAMQYIEWITSPEGQALIGEYKVEGEILFRPNYGKAQ